jgi:hypothetical protein
MSTSIAIEARVGEAGVRGFDMAILRERARAMGALPPAHPADSAYVIAPSRGYKQKNFTVSRAPLTRLGKKSGKKAKGGAGSAPPHTHISSLRAVRRTP